MAVVATVGFFVTVAGVLYTSMSIIPVFSLVPLSIPYDDVVVVVVRGLVVALTLVLLDFETSQWH